MPEFIERFFKKAKPESITFDDLRQFVSERIEENQNLEYKPRGLLVKADDSLLTTIDSRQIAGFSALAKSVAGFANAEGGLLILGVKEKAQRFKGTTVNLASVHFWPFDGWDVKPGSHVVAEVYPSMWRGQYPVDDRTPDQQDAYTVCRWLAESDAGGELPLCFDPSLSEEERKIARFEGWILSVR